MPLDSEPRVVQDRPRSLLRETWAAFRCYLYLFASTAMFLMAGWGLLNGRVPLQDARRSPASAWELAYALLLFVAIGSLLAWRSERLRSRAKSRRAERRQP